MDVDPSDAIELAIRRHCDAQRWSDAATLWIEHRGPDVLTFLAALRSEQVDGLEVFGQFCEDLWRSLPTFRWECSTRTWSYRLARNAWNRALKRVRRRGPHLALSDAPQLSAIVERVRSSTALHQRTEVKDSFTALREHLSPDDQMLLILRVDRGLGWTDVARVMLQQSGSPEDDDLAKISARCRKQFERIKRKLRALAQARGLLPE